MRESGNFYPLSQRLKEIGRGITKDPKRKIINTGLALAITGVVGASADMFMRGFQVDAKIDRAVAEKVDTAFLTQKYDQQLAEANAKVREFDFNAHKFIDPSTGLIKAPEDVIQSAKFVDNASSHSQERSQQMSQFRTQVKTQVSKEIYQEERKKDRRDMFILIPSFAIGSLNMLGESKRAKNILNKFRGNKSSSNGANSQV